MDAMKITSISPMEKFTFSVHSNWPQWRKRFERYLTVSGMSSKTDTEKIDFFLYTLGEEADSILLQFPKCPETYEEYIQCFEEYFIPSRNIIFERFKFNSRTQQKGESIESFITALHGLAEHCKYGELKDELIRDRIVVGMLDTELSRCLQLISDLTLYEAVILIRQMEMQSQQAGGIQNEEINKDDLNKKGTKNIQNKGQSQKLDTNEIPNQKKSNNTVEMNEKSNKINRKKGQSQKLDVTEIPNQKKNISKTKTNIEEANEKITKIYTKKGQFQSHQQIHTLKQQHQSSMKPEVVQHQFQLLQPQHIKNVIYIDNKEYNSNTKSVNQREYGGVCRYCGKVAHPRDECPARNSVCRLCSKTGHWDKVCMFATCPYCGKSPHERAQCPARDSICRNCSRQGHWDRVCQDLEKNKDCVIA